MKKLNQRMLKRFKPVKRSLSISFNYAHANKRMRLAASSEISSLIDKGQ